MTLHLTNGPEHTPANILCLPPPAQTCIGQSCSAADGIFHPLCSPDEYIAEVISGGNYVMTNGVEWFDRYGNPVA